MDQYHIKLEKEQFVFSAAHFITFNGNVCERLHGHNYRVFAEVYGDLDENQYVVDFIAARDAMLAITSELDHHVLLPTGHPLIRVDVQDDEVEVRFEQRRWLFPAGDCVLLPVTNTTAEQLARYIAEQFQNQLELRLGIRWPHVRVGVDENHGQWAVVEVE